MTLKMENDLSPISVGDANIVYRENLAALLRGAYLQSFSQNRIDTCRYKYPSFTEWWNTLNNKQRERVRGVLAAFIL